MFSSKDSISLKVLKYLLEKGVDIDAMGMQFHMFYDRNGEMERVSSLYNPKNLYDYLDFYSRILYNISDRNNIEIYSLYKCLSGSTYKLHP